MKIYLNSFLVSFLSLCMIGAGINYYIDPLWLFDHSHKLNQFQYGFDTRKQKAHRIYFSQQSYDALLLGSSRLVAMDPRYFGQQKLFNGAVEAMQHWDFMHHLEFFIKKHGVPKTLYIGLDFLDTGSEAQNQHRQVAWSQLETFAYRWRMLLSLDALRYAIRGAIFSYQFSQFPGNKLMYSRQGFQLDKVFSPQEADVRRQKDLSNFAQLLAEYHYQDQMLQNIQTIRLKYPQMRLVLFSTPVSAELYDLYQSHGLFNTQQHWLCQMQQQADQIFNFISYNSLTTDLDNFADAHHAYSFALKAVAQCLSGEQCPESMKTSIEVSAEQCKSILSQPTTEKKHQNNNSHNTKVLSFQSESIPKKSIPQGHSHNQLLNQYA